MAFDDGWEAVGYLHLIPRGLDRCSSIRDCIIQLFLIAADGLSKENARAGSR